MNQNQVAFASIVSSLHQSDVIISWISFDVNTYELLLQFNRGTVCLIQSGQCWNDTRKYDENHYIHGAESYSVPVNLDQHITAIFSTTQVFPRITHNLNLNLLEAAVTGKRTKKGSKWVIQSSSLVPVSFLNNLCGIISNLVVLILSFIVVKAHFVVYLLKFISSNSLGQVVFETNLQSKL